MVVGHVRNGLLLAGSLIFLGCGGPTVVLLENPLVSVVNGGQHSCGLTAQGDAFCWGENGKGQLGIGSTADQTEPARVQGDLVFASLAAGIGHTCGIATSGTTYCWGLNQSGQIGNGGDSMDLVLEPVTVSGGHQFVSLSLGGAFTCGIVASGAGYCWGWNDVGQVGDGSNTDRDVPTALNTAETFSSIAAGALHVCGVTTSGATLCWGNNTYGQLGLVPTVAVTTPQATASGFTFSKLAMGFHHTCGVEVSGGIYCWGRNHRGQLGVAGIYTSPIEVTGPQALVNVYAGRGHFTCALDATDTVYCWGLNDLYQLGHQSSELCASTIDGVQFPCTLNPTVMTSTMKFSDLAPGLHHVCGVAVSDQLVYCWGGGLAGQLGNGQSGSTYTTMEPQLVSGQQGR